MRASSLAILIAVMTASASAVQRPNLGEMISRGSFAEARQIISEGLKSNPGDPELLYWSAAVEFESGNPAQAIEILEGLRARQEAQPPHLFLLAHIREERQEWSDAAQVYQALENRSPGTEITLKLGFVQFKGRDYAAAVATLETLTAQPGAGAEAHHLLGISYLGLGKREEATRELQAAIQLDPRKAAFHYDLGLALLESEKFTESAEAFRQAARLRPDWPEAHLYLGRALHDANFAEDALAEFEAARKLNPELPLLHHHFGLAYKGRGEAERAIQEFQREIDAESHYAPTFFHLAELLYNRQEKEKSRELLQTAVRLEPQNPEYRLLAVKIEMALENLEAADQQLQIALKLAPSSSSAYYQLGRLRQVQGKPEEARKAFEISRQLADRQGLRKPNP